MPSPPFETSLKSLSRRVPARAAGWLQLLGEAGGPKRAETLALAAALAVIAASLASAYRRAGSEVRELVWALHAGLRGEVKALPAAIPPESAAEIHWLISRCHGPDPAAAALRRSVMLWIDTASERLTMRAYHREGQRAQQARVLLAEPLAALGVIQPLPAAPAPAPAIFERIIRFHDLLAAESNSPQGFNRIAPAQGGFGGFYGMVDSTAGATPEELAEAIRALLAELESAPAAPTGEPVLDSITPAIEASLKQALAHRAARGAWPAGFSWDAPAPQSLISRLFGRR